MWIKEQLESLEIQKQNIKVNWFCEINPHTFIFDDKDIEIKSISNKSWILSIIAICEWKEEEYNYKNPPILIEDWTFTEQIIDWIPNMIPNLK